MEHLQEIRMLRHQLEESIKTNDRLRKQLEQQVVDFAQDQGKIYNNYVATYFICQGKMCWVG